MHEHVKEGIRRRIHSDGHKVGDNIPSELELCRIFGVSRSTVRQAVKGLVDEGILATWQGKGTYVIALNPVKGHSPFPMKVGPRGRPEYKFLHSDIIPAPVDVALAFNVPPGTPVFYFERLRLGQGTILGIKRAYIVLDVLRGETPTTEELVDGDLIDEMLERRGIHVEEIVFTVRPMLFSGIDCELTDTPEQTLGLQILRIGYAAEGRPVRLSDTLLRSDRAVPSFNVATRSADEMGYGRQKSRGAQADNFNQPNNTDQSDGE